MCSGAHGSNPMARRLLDVSLDIAAEMGDTVKFVRSGAMDILMTPGECKWG